MNERLQALQRAASIGREQMQIESVNWTDKDKDRFWCPCCSKNQSHPGVVAPWISPQAILVCYYLLCRRCVKSSNPQSVADLVERNLLSKYPFIASKLPPNYFNV